MDWKKTCKKFIKTVKQAYVGRFESDKKSWADYPGVGKITNYDVWKHVKKHTHWYDRLNPRFIVHCAIESQNHLFGVYDEPKDAKWKYPE